ncbi:glycosyltransferase [Roseateles sp.]|uniref:glycosyltransferase n=1 Tax=Roseateles sp. TaxID=1971397 RepID=UPI003262CE6B
MARYAFIWELGGAYGHLGRMIPVARELQQRGHEVVFIIRELVEAERLLGPHGFKWYQAPLWIGRVLHLPDPLSLAELLMGFGFLDPPALLSICRAWRNLLAALAVDALLFDCSPTAVVASRGLGLPSLNLANGFQVPPTARPLPPLRWWQKAPPARLLDSEQQIVHVTNQVLYELGAPPIENVLQILSGGDDVFATLPELDHYPQRAGGDFVGPIYALGRGEAVHWPAKGALKVFAYLKPDYGGLDALLTVLSQLDASVLVHIPGVSKRTIEKFGSDQLQISRQPLDIEQVRQSCDVAVLHAGLSTVAAMLLAGKPVLLFPQQLEQTMFARSVETLGVGVSIAEAAAQFPRLVKRALADASLAEKARQFADKYRGYDQQHAIRAVADRCEALLGKA